MKQMLTRPGALQGSAPGLGVSDGVCEGKREREKWIQDYAAERGALPGKILRLRPGACCFVPARIRETVRRFSVLLAHSISA